MARVTVEDCLDNVKNRFELVILASKRARQLMRGSSEPKVAWENDKATVVALREIAMGYTDFADAHPAEHAPTNNNAEPLASLEEEETETTLEIEIESENTTEVTETPTREVSESDHSAESE